MRLPINFLPVRYLVKQRKVGDSLNGTLNKNLKLIKQRGRLVDTAQKYGYSDPRTLKESRKLDKLVIEMQGEIRAIETLAHLG